MSLWLLGHFIHKTHIVHPLCLALYWAIYIGSLQNCWFHLTDAEMEVQKVKQELHDWEVAEPDLTQVMLQALCLPCPSSSPTLKGPSFPCLWQFNMWLLLIAKFKKWQTYKLSQHGNTAVYIHFCLSLCSPLIAVLHTFYFITRVTTMSGHNCILWHFHMGMIPQHFSRVHVTCRFDHF